MEKIVIDTDVLINHSRGNTEVLDAYFRKQERNEVDLYIPTAVLFEFYAGVPTTENALTSVEAFFVRFVIHDLTASVARRAGKLVYQYFLAGKLSSLDVIIAATVLELEAKLLTGNKRHFSLVPGIKFAE